MGFKEGTGITMNPKIMLISALLIFSAMSVGADEFLGSCSSVSTQCELAISNLQLCNDSPETRTYNTSIQGEVASWLSIIPKTVTIESGECEQLRTFAIAECYAEPGTYTAEVVVTNGGRHSITCELEIEQGHFVDVDIQPKHEEVSQCEAATYEITLTNNTIVPNQRTESVKLSIDGIPSEWYELEKAEIIVAKGSPEKITLTVQAPCDQELGTYEFEAKAALFNPDFYSTDNAEYVIVEGQDLDIERRESGSNEYLACTEEDKEYVLTLTNNGDKDDVYDLELDGPEWAGLDMDSVELRKGESKDITIILKANSGDRKNYTAKLIATSTRFNFKREVSLDLSLKDCYDVFVEKLEGSEIACVEKNPVYKFRLKNGPVTDMDVQVSIDGTDAKIDDDSFTLNKGQTKEIEAEIDVKGLAEEGSVSRKDVEIEILMDASASMKNSVEGKEKMSIAKDAIVNFVDNITQVELGLRVFGHKDGCTESELLVPISKLDVEEITSKVNSFQATGKTPVAETLEASVNDFSNNGERYVILVSDGKESCEGNVKRAAEELKRKGIIIYAIGFDIDQTGKAQLIEAAGRTGGEYYDAANQDELLEVFRNITRELEIEQSRKGEATFTLNVKGKNFSYSKDYTIEITDCHNVAVVAPELNVCRGTSGSDFISLTNIGTEAQMVDIKAQPSWIDPEVDRVSLPPGREDQFGITYDVPANASEEEYVVSATSGNVESESRAFINYLSDTSCFGFDLIIVRPEIDAATCEGVQQSLILENRGQTATEVTLKSDRGFVYFVDEKVQLEKGERKEVYFFISPPFDIKEDDSLITITASNSRGIQGKGFVKLNLVGSSYGLGQVKINIRDVVTAGIDQNRPVDVDAIVDFSLYNDSNRTLEIFSVEAANYDANFDIENESIPANSSADVRMLVDLPENYDRETATIALKVLTNEGTFVRNIEFRTKEGAAPGQGSDTNGTDTNAGVTPVQPEAGSIVSIGSGLFTFANIRNAIIVILVLLVVALIVYSVFKVTGGGKEAPMPVQPEAPVAAAEAEAAKKGSKSPKPKKGKK